MKSEPPRSAIPYMMLALAPEISPEPLFSYGRGPDFPEFIPWALAVAVILIVAEYARRSSSNR